jgi:hypothetical protein
MRHVLSVVAILAAHHRELLHEPALALTLLWRGGVEARRRRRVLVFTAAVHAPRCACTTPACSAAMGVATPRAAWRAIAAALTSTPAAALSSPRAQYLPIDGRQRRHPHALISTELWRPPAPHRTGVEAGAASL